ncbi:MAG: L-histidine N(alpha)-methyltransferase [Solirubrobacterales bacterium]|nr:L-histidine N(alpha)-methyltransferase [Solirubrobacterales bacterium]
MSSALTPSVRVLRGPDAGASTLADDVRAGFQKPLKELPPKHLYDELGSQLFDRICTLPEYYPTRTERAILEREADRIAALTDAAELVELGSGTAAKTRVLMDALNANGTLRTYVGFDIEEQIVRDTAQRLALEYPELAGIEGVVGDFEADLMMLEPAATDTRRLIALLGGTIGNFVEEPRRRLLGSIADMMGPDDHLLLGTDLVKDPHVIEAAYDDAAGVTASFNLNVLEIINRELEADFPVENFAHVARFDRDREWLEMRLAAQHACQVRIDALDLQVDFAEGEEIRTEISAKFTRARIEADLRTAGLEPVELMSDPEGLYALTLARPVNG